MTDGDFDNMNEHMINRGTGRDENIDLGELPLAERRVIFRLGVTRVTLCKLGVYWPRSLQGRIRGRRSIELPGL